MSYAAATSVLHCEPEGFTDDVLDTYVPSFIATNAAIDRHLEERKNKTSNVIHLAD